jgi:multidrug efflux system membrane fusion protein
MIGALSLGPNLSPAPRRVVPLSALVRAPGHPDAFAVFRLRERDGKTYAMVQNITPGSTYGNSIEVISGVSTGEHIVGMGGELLRDGQEVRVLP